MRFTKKILSILAPAVILMWSCNVTRYVPQDKYLLTKNFIEIQKSKGLDRKDIITTDQLSEYIKQRPNSRVLGIGFELGFYNLSDTSKNNWWQRLWREKIGAPPVIFDSVLMSESAQELDIYIHSRGYLNGKVSDSVVLKNRRAMVYYNVEQNKPYTISKLAYNIEDPFLRQILMSDTAKSLIKVGQIYQRLTLQRERERITNNLRNSGFYTFGNSFITYTARLSHTDNTVAITLDLKKRIDGFSTGGVAKYANHPIYRIGTIKVVSDFDPKTLIENIEVKYDSIECKGIKILYSGKLQIKPEVLAAAVRIAPNAIYNQTTVQRTGDNLRNLGFPNTILFSPVVEQDYVTVTIPSVNDPDVHTTERLLNCLIQCTPPEKQSFTQNFEISTTAAFSGISLNLGYQNRNLLKGAENFMVNFRGAYEFVRSQDKNNSYEVGVTTSLALPRFLLPVNSDKVAMVRNKSTKIQLSASTQERPDYHRNLYGISYGYGWNNRMGAVFQFNPLDVNVVQVPWVNEQFLDSINNPYLRNSYESLMIIGLSTTYTHISNSKYQFPGRTFRIGFESSGNLINLFEKAITKIYSNDTLSYRTFLGLRYSQYVRATFDYSQRINLNEYNQIAWRFFAGVGIAYGNSDVIPFERRFFAGGSNSMRGWQVRTLGPGSSNYFHTLSSYPNQLGDIRLEANLEYRFNIWGGLNGAIFFDAGNIWMNSKARQSEEEAFRLKTFAQQIAFNTGAGLRWDFNFLLLRLDWGVKLHSPGMPAGERWFRQMGMADTALHFAIGLPF